MTTLQECKLPLEKGTILVVINALFSLVGTLGNILIIMAVLNTPRLRQKPSNFLLLSLAVADLLVTMVAQPLFTTSISMKTFVHQCHREVDMIYVVTAALAGGSSVFHLAAISIDRAISTLKPHQHRDIIKKALKVMLCTCWGLAALVAAIIIGYPVAASTVYIVLLLCLGVMVVAYGMILYKILSNHTVNVVAHTARDRAMEKRVSGTVAIIIALFAVCWVPLIAFHLSRSSTTATETTYWWIRTLYLANSSMNFIVYSLRIRHFRTAFMKIINKTMQRVLPNRCQCCIPGNLDSKQNQTPVSLATPFNTFPINSKQTDEQKQNEIE